MNNHAKRLCKHLESLDFRRDYDAEQRTNARRVYVHANEPGTQIKVHDCMNDFTITTQTKNANRIVGLAMSGPDAPKLKERVKAERSRAKSKQQRAMEARLMRAAKADEEYEARQAVARRARATREIRDLMQPRYGR